MSSAPTLSPAPPVPGPEGVGAAFDYPLEVVLHLLESGRLELRELAPALRAWYFAGFNAGRASLEPALAAAEYDRDRYFEQLHNPGRKFTDMIRRRVDQAAEVNANEADATKYYMAVLEAATRPRKAA